ncbi:MAG: hypothetical protein R3F48_10770 [Candidatus Zixiibacteriota bacterium]
MRLFKVLAPAFILCIILCSYVDAQNLNQSNYIIESVRPNYLAPAQILDIVGAETFGNSTVIRWQAGDSIHRVDVKVNETSNIILLCGPEADIEIIKKLIHEADVSPRQIEIEVKMVEIYTDKAQDIGIDWESIIQSGAPDFQYQYSEDNDDLNESSYNSTSTQNTTRRSSDYNRINRDYRVSSRVDLGESLHLLQKSGAGRIFNAPKILTLNNQRATILDGSRTTYIAQLSSYNNIFRTDSMDAGITLSVIPSLGESGYMTLDITAEVTALSRSGSSGSPTKDGQIIENKVIVRNGESIILGGMTRTVEHKSKKRFPVLGQILPFLFSREIVNNEEVQTVMVLTPRVIDLESNMTDRTQILLEDKE